MRPGDFLAEETVMDSYRPIRLLTDRSISDSFDVKHRLSKDQGMFISRLIGKSTGNVHYRKFCYKSSVFSAVVKDGLDEIIWEDAARDISEELVVERVPMDVTGPIFLDSNVVVLPVSRAMELYGLTKNRNAVYFFSYGRYKEFSLQGKERKQVKEPSWLTELEGYHIHPRQTKGVTEVLLSAGLEGPEYAGKYIYITGHGQVWVLLSGGWIPLGDRKESLDKSFDVLGGVHLEEYQMMKNL